MHSGNIVRVQLVVKVIWPEAASPPHTDGSVVFARWRQSAHTCNTCFHWPTRVHVPNSISIGSAVFAQLTTEGPYTLQWATPFPLQNCQFAWGSGPPWFRGSTPLAYVGAQHACSVSYDKESSTEASIWPADVVDLLRRHSFSRCPFWLGFPSINRSISIVLLTIISSRLYDTVYWTLSFVLLSAGLGWKLWFSCAAQEKDYDKHRQYLAQMAQTTKPYQSSPRKSQVVLLG